MTSIKFHEQLRGQDSDMIMQREIRSPLRCHFLGALVIFALATGACVKLEQPGSSCGYLIKLLGDEGKRRSLEAWFEYIYDNPAQWQEVSESRENGRRFRGAGALHISVPDVSRLKELGLPEHTQLSASVDADGNATQLIAAVTEQVGILYSKDNQYLVVFTVPDNRSERMGVLCTKRD